MLRCKEEGSRCGEGRRQGAAVGKEVSRAQVWGRKEAGGTGMVWGGKRSIMYDSGVRKGRRQKQV